MKNKFQENEKFGQITGISKKNRGLIKKDQTDQHPSPCTRQL
jgi:hypothetical protein